MSDHLTSVWIVGAGAMAVEYAKVQSALEKQYTVVGRSEERCRTFEEKTGHKAVPGGLDAFLASQPTVAQNAIVAVNPNQLSAIACALLKVGVKRVLLEKPAGLNLEQVQAVCDAAEVAKAEVYVAYNRRFYSSVMAGEKIIREDGGVKSFHFEFTEWAHRIVALPKPKEELAAWFLANSTHVVDTAFFMGGMPVDMHCVINGSLSWYPAAAAFAGSGMTDSGAIFSYEANWSAPGRWVIEMLTNKHRLIYRPMEQLQIQEIGSVAVNPVEIDDTLDKQFKAGLYLQTEAFLKGDASRMLTIDGQLRHMVIYGAIERGEAYKA